MDKSKECSVVALYGADLEAPRLEEVYRHCVDWFESLGCPPERLSVHGEGHSGKVVSFKASAAVLRRNGFGTVTSFSLYSLGPEGDVPIWDWQMTAEVSATHATCIFGARSSIATLGSSSIRQVARSIVEAARPKYGIGFCRNLRLGPSLYGAGICQGLQPWGGEEVEGSRISNWRRVGMKERVFEHGILRDVYPMNFLTSFQLEREINSSKLSDWIGQDRSRGAIAPFSGDVTLWTIPEEQLASVRSALEDSSILFDATKYARR